MASMKEVNELGSYAKGWGVNIGCGPRPFPGAINVDLNPDALADVFADAANLPFYSNRFDFLVSSHCLEHVQQAPLIVLREWLRVLKPGGVLAFIVPNGQDGPSALGESPDYFVAGKHVHIFTPETLKCLVEYAGAAVERCEIITRSEWKTTTILLVARRGMRLWPEIDSASIEAKLIWLKAVRKNVTARGLKKWFSHPW